MIEIYLDAIGLAAPGLPGWEDSQPVLRGQQPWQPQPLARYKPQRLPRNEARRATELVRLAFRVCEDLAEQTDNDLSQCASVFSSSGGDYPVVDHICRAVNESGRPVSPTQFHNSVHNAAAGYWSIATGCQAPSTSLAAYDDSFAAGLLEAAIQCSEDRQTTLLASYDVCPPEPLQAKRPITEPFGCALLLSPEASAESRASLRLTAIPPADNSLPRQADLAVLWHANPAARSLPLLELLACGQAGSFTLSTEHGPALLIEVTPCR